jgi:hypothetical protein
MCTNTHVELFLNSPYQETRDVEIATITGVGSSALGSAALAWNISLALEKSVLAIVPGYGMADVILQVLGGWLGFGLYDYLHAKSLVQNSLANAAPQTASIGRQLSASTRSLWPGALREGSEYSMLREQHSWRLVIITQLMSYVGANHPLEHPGRHWSADGSERTSSGRDIP